MTTVDAGAVVLQDRVSSAVEQSAMSERFTYQEYGHIETTSIVFSGDVAEWLGRGLQSPLLRFESGRRLQIPKFSAQRKNASGVRLCRRRAQIH